MRYDDFAGMPHVKPCDLSATHGGVNHNIDIRDPEEIAERRVQAIVEAQRRLMAYRTWPLDSIGAGHVLTTHRRDMAENRSGGGIVNANERPRRRRGFGSRVRHWWGGAG